MPVISVVIPVYNKEKFIANTIYSVLNQTLSDFELIIVDDSSTDKSLSIIDSIKDKRIKTYSIKNSGVSKSRNYGVEKSSSNLIAFLDADDLWKNNHLEQLYKLYLENPNCGMYAMSYIKNINFKSYKKSYFGLSNFSGILENFFTSSSVDCIASSSSVMIPLFVFKKINGFNENLKKREDTALWIKIALNYKIAFSTITTVEIVITEHGNHLSKSHENPWYFFDLFKFQEQNNVDLKKFLDLNRFSEAINFKLNKDHNNFKKIIKSINYRNLNFKQKILIKTPFRILFFLKKIQSYLLKKNIYITTFK
jgi:glycosyltransferase involved in cell wall biosynthesis